MKRRQLALEPLSQRRLLAADLSVENDPVFDVATLNSAAYFSRAVPSFAITNTRLIQPAGGTRENVDGNDGFRIEIVPGLQLRNQFNALAAVERAAQQWEAMIADPITVTIHVDLHFEDPDRVPVFPEGVIGFARPVEVELPYAEVRAAMQGDGLIEQDDSILAHLPSPETIEFAYPGSLRFGGNIALTKANLKSLGLHSEAFDDALGVSDGQILLNTSALSTNAAGPFDYNKADGISPGQFDFESLVVHEIGHVLGFISAVDRIDAAMQNDVENVEIAPTTLDLFRFRSLPGTGNPRTPAAFAEVRRELRPSAPAVLDFVTQDRWTTLQTEFPVELGEDVGLIVDETLADDVLFGYQASHWQAEDLFGRSIGAMGPVLSPQTVSPISNVDLRAFDLIGYDILPPGEPAAAPILVDDAAVLADGRRLVIDALANDQNNVRPLRLASLRILEPPAGGVVTFDPVSGFFVYEADPGFAGQDVFTYTVADDRGIFGIPAVVTIDLQSVATGLSPVAVDDFVLTRVGQEVRFNPLTNDTDADESLAFANVQITSDPTNGTVTRRSDHFVYEPDAGFVGEDSIRYSITDAAGNIATAMVEFTVGATIEPVVIPGQPLTLMQRADVSNDQRVTAVDALMVINYLNRNPDSTLFGESDDASVDVNGDGRVTALDALTIINLLNRSSSMVLMAESHDDEDENETVMRDENSLF